MECFQKISAAIGPVYSRLTANHGADGGSAYLDLEDLRELTHTHTDVARSSTDEARNSMHY